MALVLDIPKTARAAVLNAKGEEYSFLSSHPVPQPESLKPGECLVKIECSGVCHSDLHIKHGQQPWTFRAKLPLIGGHEGIGTVVAIGQHTHAPQVKVGDRVGLKWIADVCGHCDMCRQAHEQSSLNCIACRSSKAHGFTVDGSFQEYVVSYVNYVTPIPEGLDSITAAPLLCGGLTIYRAMKEAGAKAGDWVAIAGAGGGLGHLGVQFAVAMGLRVIAIDTGEAKRKLCTELGAEAWVDFRTTENLVQAVVSIADNLGPHAAVLTVGEARPFNDAILYLRNTGTLVSVGLPHSQTNPEIPLIMIIAKTITIKGTMTGNREDMAEALALAARGKVKLNCDVRKLEQLNDVMNELDKGDVAGRIVLKM
ncbi:hypothetical protein AMATHDRAFT_137183 [Amanita thiersii Skay4041]|uniref:alcohol dehydrogenase n=1 Tax=Amanita thiersii Skay4041 TaxID=703135 RepID=A0A2A9NSK2_9AGAR|nr:hypothetical protein AMATHDRAFT_137183 [Amanita thiersii Skay4041]